MSLEGALPSLSLLNGTLPLVGALTSEEVDPETCRLLGPLALAVQGVMGIIVLGSLVLKRAREKPRRKWRVWFGDVSKQVLGQAFVHTSNVAISDLIARHKADNPCSLYALNIAIDTTLGVLILFAFLKLLNIAVHHFFPSSLPTGDYGTPFRMSVWAQQAAVYVLALALMKGVVVGLLWAVPGLLKAVSWGLSWLWSDEAQVVFVMLIFPLVMNVLQFLIIDSILKSKPTAATSSAALSDEESRRGFLTDQEDSSDDDGDDDEDRATKRHVPKRDLEADADSHPASSSVKIRPGGAGAVEVEEVWGSFEDDDDEEEGGDDDVKRKPAESPPLARDEGVTTPTGKTSAMDFGSPMAGAQVATPTEEIRPHSYPPSLSSSLLSQSQKSSATAAPPYAPPTSASVFTAQISPTSTKLAVLPDVQVSDLESMLAESDAASHHNDDALSSRSSFSDAWGLDDDDDPDLSLDSNVTEKAGWSPEIEVKQDLEREIRSPEKGGRESMDEIGWGLA